MQPAKLAFVARKGGHVLHAPVLDQKAYLPPCVALYLSLIVAERSPCDDGAAC
jgi:hypothetical protein